MTKPAKTPRTPMPHQDARARAGNFDEVALGYTAELAATEAARCLQCKKPLCVDGCPVGIDIPGFIKPLVEGDVGAAYGVLREYNSLPAVCGRVCPQETQCEGKCILGKKGESVAIGRLERYAADAFAASDACEELTGAPECTMPGEASVACVGAGPASLTVAGYLAARGARVTVYEALHEPGGVLVYGIPEFRLPKDIVRREIAAMEELGVHIRTNMVGGKTVTLEELRRDHDAVFLGVGAGLPRFLNVPGESLVGVFSANEYLTRVNLGRAYDFPEWDTPCPQARHAVIIGGGNVAMDAARTALRLGAENVSIVYRRTRDEMPARLEELEHAVEEGVELLCLCGPLSFNGDDAGRLTSMTVQKMQLGEPDESGRCRPECIDGATEEVPCDLAIIAVGTGPNPVLLEASPELPLNRWGYIDVDPDTGETALENVFAGGDIVSGAATVILAMGAGRTAAREIERRLLRAEG